MYDLDGDDRISKEELLAVLTMMVRNTNRQNKLEKRFYKLFSEAPRN